MDSAVMDSNEKEAALFRLIEQNKKAAEEIMKASKVITNNLANTELLLRNYTQEMYNMQRGSDT